MLAAARAGSAVLVQADGLRLPLPTAALDGLVSGFALRNFADLAGTIAECARAIRPGGRIALLEVDTPSSPLLRLGHRLWFRHAVPRIGAALSDASAYRYLPRSVAYLPERGPLLALVRQAGFEDVEHHRLSGGITQVVTATRAGGPRLGPPGR
jgi:demethylmenaquinone methyltransferase/2-methoxy-6-polyprenyl-1,4-benzoquinol methylase